ncbi:MAG TPA: ABC transporter ATP-binding protein [Polyangiaceae bacterium]
MKLAATVAVALHDDDELPRRLDYSVIGRLLAYTHRYAPLRNKLLVLVLARAIQTPLLTWLTAKVISGSIAHGDYSKVCLGVAGFLVLELFTEAVFVFRMHLALRLGEAVVHDLRNELHRHMMEMPLSFFQQTKVGRLISRMTSDVDNLRIGVQDVAFVSMIQFGTMVISALLMAYYDWMLFAVVLAMVPVLWWLIEYFRGKMILAYKRVQASFSRVTATLAESVRGIRVIQGFVRQDVNGGLFGGLIHDHSRNNMEAVKLSAVFQPLLEFNGQLFLAVLLVVGGYRALHGTISLETLIQFLFLSNLFFGPVPVLGRQYNNALTAMAGAERVFELLDMQPEWSDDPAAKDLPEIKGRVQFRHLNFEYVPGEPVLHDINFTAEPGQVTALVGHTGSGKSSIIKLVAKLYLPTSGEVLIDGHRVETISGLSLHRQIGTVPQDNFLFSGTVRENILLGRTAATDAEVAQALDALDVRDLIEELPQGLDTQVGEKGVNLSLGQRQIVCFARAMLANPKILILDEATSSVDPVTEERLQSALMKLLEGRTSFVIAHRLSTIRHAHAILVMERGRIAERGTHEELCLHGGVYADLYRQFIGGSVPGAAA